MVYALTYRRKIPRNFYLYPGGEWQMYHPQRRNFLKQHEKHFEIPPVSKIYIFFRVASPVLFATLCSRRAPSRRPFSFRGLYVTGTSVLSVPPLPQLRDPILTADKSLLDLIWRITATIRLKGRREKIFRPTLTDIFIWHLFRHLFSNCLKKNESASPFSPLVTYQEFYIRSRDSDLCKINVSHFFI